MVAPQVTQHEPGSRGDSVRITAEQRRQVLRKHYEDELVHWQAIAASESNDLKVLRRNGLPVTQAECRAANALAVAQYLGSTLRALGGNRDFKAVQR